MTGKKGLDLYAKVKPVASPMYKGWTVTRPMCRRRPVRSLMYGRTVARPRKKACSGKGLKQSPAVGSEHC